MSKSPNGSELIEIVPAGGSISFDEIRAAVVQACPEPEFSGKRILLIVPDATRTAPVDLLFKSLHAQLGAITAAFDVMVALGTHPPMSEQAICERLGISLSERSEKYARVQLINHEWNNPAALQSLGVISADEIRTLSSGLFAVDVEVKINRRLFDYD